MSSSDDDQLTILYTQYLQNVVVWSQQHDIRIFIEYPHSPKHVCYFTEEYHHQLNDGTTRPQKIVTLQCLRVLYRCYKLLLTQIWLNLKVL